MCREFKRSHLDPGGFAEVRPGAPDNVRGATFRVPDHLGDEKATFVEPLACCLRAVERVRAAGDTVAVVGLGSIGCLFVQLLRRAGATVVGIDQDDARFVLARDSRSRPRDRRRAPRSCAASPRGAAPTTSS